MKKSSKIVVFGASGLVGSAIVRKLIEKDYVDIIGTYHNRKPNFFYPLSPTPYPISLISIDLTNQQQVGQFFDQYRPDYIFLAAAKVGGIWANNVYRADFIYQNLQIQNNVIHNAYKYGVKKLLFLGSTCIYPKDCPQPIKEEYLLTAPLEYTNEPYAIAKIAGIKMCESYNLQYGTNFISVMPTNLYGPNDNFDLEKSHVLPALIRKIHLGKCLEENNWNAIKQDLDKNPIEGVDGNADKGEILKVLEKYGIRLVNSDQLSVNSRQLTAHRSPITDHRSQLTAHSSHVTVEIWGTGKPLREFLYVDDMADACVYLMEKIDFEKIIKLQLADHRSLLTDHSSQFTDHEVRNTHINIGTGVDISIKELAELIKKIVGFKGELYFNTAKPDGTMRKLTDPSKLHSLGWRHTVELEDGLKAVYEWYLNKK